MFNRRQPFRAFAKVRLSHLTKPDRAISIVEHHIHRDLPVARRHIASGGVGAFMRGAGHRQKLRIGRESRACLRCMLALDSRDELPGGRPKLDGEIVLRANLRVRVRVRVKIRVGVGVGVRVTVLVLVSRSGSRLEPPSEQTVTKKREFGARSTAPIGFACAPCANSFRRDSPAFCCLPGGVIVYARILRAVHVPTMTLRPLAEREHAVPWSSFTAAISAGGSAVVPASDRPAKTLSVRSELTAAARLPSCERAAEVTPSEKPLSVTSSRGCVN